MAELLDRRIFATDAIVIPFRGALAASSGPVAEALLVHDSLILEKSRLSPLRQRRRLGWVDAARSLPLRRHLYPSFARDDHRQLLQLVSIEHPIGGTPARAEAYLLLQEAVMLVNLSLSPLSSRRSPQDHAGLPHERTRPTASSPPLPRTAAAPPSCTAGSSAARTSARSSSSSMCRILEEDHALRQETHQREREAL